MKKPRQDTVEGLTRRELINAASAITLGVFAGCRPQDRTEQAASRDHASLPTDLWRASATRLADAIRQGEVSSQEVVEAHLQRIESVNDKVRAVVRVLADEARKSARAADAAVAAGTPLGALHGVPFTIKENIDLLGHPTTMGVPALSEAMPERDAPVVERMKMAGAIPLGRTNLPDFGLRVATESHLHGPTFNPWNRARNVGGSSGGEAAALATGMSPIGLGNDIGGSLRNPAHCAGIASLKPSLGRIPSAGGSKGALLASQLMGVQGPMARHVRDLKAAHEILSGPHVRDPWSMPVPLRLEQPQSPIRVALVPNPSGGETHPSIAAGVRKAGETLQEAGYAVTEIEPPQIPEVAEVWGRFIATDFSVEQSDIVKMMSKDAARFLTWGLEILKPADAAGFSKILARRHAMAAAWQEFHSQYPLIVGPIFTQPPFEVGYDIGSKDQAADTIQQLRFVVCANLLGLPAAVVPVGIDQELPLAVEIVGDRYREDLCLDAAQVIEDTLGTITPIDPM